MPEVVATTPHTPAANASGAVTGKSSAPAPSGRLDDPNALHEPMATRRPREGQLSTRRRSTVRTARTQGSSTFHARVITTSANEASHKELTPCRPAASLNGVALSTSPATKGQPAATAWRPAHPATLRPTVTAPVTTGTCTSSRRQLADIAAISPTKAKLVHRRPSTEDEAAYTAVTAATSTGAVGANEIVATSLAKATTATGSATSTTGESSPTGSRRALSANLVPRLAKPGGVTFLSYA